MRMETKYVAMLSDNDDHMIWQYFRKERSSQLAEIKFCILKVIT